LKHLTASILFAVLSIPVWADELIAQYNARDFHPDQNPGYDYSRIQNQGGDTTDKIFDIITGSDAPLLALIVGCLGLFIWKNEQSARADRSALNDRLFDVIKDAQASMDGVKDELTAIKIQDADTNARVSNLERETEGIKERLMMMKV
tara:strand:+ start:786 stop:1229 length:444 start_codon:yes stop_codon:yes gene_type:complete